MGPQATTGGDAHWVPWSLSKIFGLLISAKNQCVTSFVWCCDAICWCWLGEICCCFLLRLLDSVSEVKLGALTLLLVVLVTFWTATVAFFFWLYCCPWHCCLWLAGSRMAFAVVCYSPSIPVCQNVREELWIVIDVTTNLWQFYCVLNCIDPYSVQLQHKTEKVVFKTFSFSCLYCLN